MILDISIYNSVKALGGHYEAYYFVLKYMRIIS